MKLSAFVVTLRKATQRLPQVEWIRKNSPIPCQVFDAVDGNALTKAEIDQVYQPGKFHPRYPFKLNPAEIGCFLSHRGIYQAVIDQQLDAALVLEDDIAFEPARFAEAVWFAVSQMQGNDYIQFSVRPIKNRYPVISRCGDYSLIRPPLPLPGTTSLLLSREASKRLLHSSSTFDRPIDSHVQMTWQTHVPVHCVAPQIVREISTNLGGSTIQNSRRSWMDFLRIEFARPLYRAKMRFASRHECRQACRKNAA